MKTITLSIIIIDALLVVVYFGINLMRKVKTRNYNKQYNEMLKLTAKAVKSSKGIFSF